MDYPLRREFLLGQLPELEVDALLVSHGPNVRYLTGFAGSNGQMLVGQGEAVFLTDARYEEQARQQVPDLRRVTYYPDLTQMLGGLCEELGARRVGFEAAAVTYKTYQRLANDGPVELVPVVEVVERLRWAKDPEELSLIERAQELTDHSYELATTKLTEGMTEKEVALELELAMRQAGADGIAFDSIVAFGENAAEPHHRPEERALAAGDVVKLDFGCVVEGYHSDMTRTVAFGEPHPELREVYELVLRAQRAGVEALRPGVTGGTADKAARDVIREAGYGDRFGHSLGHGVGLEVHEGPGLRRESDDQVPEGAVVTVEPGVYVPGLGGVRIEDMVVVESDGARSLPSTPRDLVVL